MMAPYVLRFLTGVMEEVRREFELWRWRREYERLPQGPPHDFAHPITRAIGPFPSPVMSPLITWSEPAANRAGAGRVASSQLDLF